MPDFLSRSLLQWLTLFCCLVTSLTLVIMALIWQPPAIVIAHWPQVKANTVAIFRPTPTKVLLVHPAGIDKPDGGSQRAPLKTINYALTLAQPGTTIQVAPGEYKEFLHTHHSGTTTQPIQLRTQGRVVLKPVGSEGRLFEITHDHYVIEGFEFTGSDILLWLQNAHHNRIRYNYFHHALGECVRIKYHSTYNEFAHNQVRHCGRDDFVLEGGGKNGEGVYLGTAPEQLFKNPSPERDTTNHNHIHHNDFATYGNECVDIKEGSSHNVVEYNRCNEQRDPKSAGLDSRGNNNIFRYNISQNNVGAGIRLGGDEEDDGLGNQVYGNQLLNNQEVALKVMRLPQSTICGNISQGNAAGFSNQKSIQNTPCPFPLP